MTLMEPIVKVTILSIYPLLITLSLVVFGLWAFAVPRLDGDKRIAAIGVALLAFGLGVENTYYFTARMLGETAFLEASYAGDVIAGMKGLYCLGLFVLINFFGRKH